MYCLGHAEHVCMAFPKSYIARLHGPLTTVDPYILRRHAEHALMYAHCAPCVSALRAP